MLLRSSSTPVLKSLLPSFSENPNTTPHHETPSPIHHSLSKLSFHQTGSSNLSSFSCNSSPSITVGTGFRRAQSEGNLQGLAPASSCTSFDEPSDLKLPTRHLRRPSCPVLQTIPSFSFYGSNGELKDGEESDDDEENEEMERIEENGGLMEKPVVEGENKSLLMGQGESHLAKPKLGLIEEREFMNGFGSSNFQEIGEKANLQMYLAIGLGVSGDGRGRGGGRGDFTLHDFGKGGGDGDGPEMEEYYKRLVEENPGNPLFLRNYAQFLYHKKRDPQRAEEYYSRAVLADPTDGEILSQYAKLTWELHHDEDRTSSYFERAVRAAPEDSHVHAAYACFLWEAEDDEDENEDVGLRENDSAPPLYHSRTMVSASA